MIKTSWIDSDADFNSSRTEFKGIENYFLSNYLQNMFGVLSKPLQSRLKSKFKAGIGGKNGWAVPKILSEIGVPNWLRRRNFL